MTDESGRWFRPLADHIERLVPNGGRVATFHTLSDAWLRAQDVTPDVGP